MGYLPPPDPRLIGTDYDRSPSAPRLNLDRFGMPRDYATYVWLLYGKRVNDESPARRAFPTFGTQRIGPSRDTR